MKLIKSMVLVFGLVCSVSAFATENIPQCPSADQFTLSATQVYDADYGFMVFFPNIQANNQTWSAGVLNVIAGDQQTALKNVIAGVKFLSKVPVEIVMKDDEQDNPPEYACVYPVSVAGSEHAYAVAFTPALPTTAKVNLMRKINGKI